MKRQFAGLALLAAVATTAAIGPALADDKVYNVTITNVTMGQPFAPVVVATHKRGVSIFTPGSAASDELATLAETGNPGPLTGLLAGTDGVLDVQHTASLLPATGGILLPGHSVTVKVKYKGDYKRISIAGMLVTTNDGFAGLNGVRGHKRATYYAPAWDAGSEVNDELCANIPGPPCSESSGNAGDDEDGVVHIHNGIHGIGGEIAASESDWRNPVAVVHISRAKDEDED